MGERVEMAEKHNPTFSADSQRPDLSLAIPCYNEADVIRITATELVRSFNERNMDVELVLVDNGSMDDTGDIIDDLIMEGLPIVKETVTINEGYGKGVLCGLKACRGKMVGFMCADGQIEARDVARLSEIAVHARTPKLFKVRRRFRLEGVLRRVVSSTYNLLTTALFGNLGSLDLNANPKILPREYIERMNLQSKDWFLDPEVMIKAKRMGLEIFEINVFSQMRPEHGVTKPRPSTCWEFIKNLFHHRFGKRRHVLLIQPFEPTAGASKISVNVSSG
jgi:glycosyltransferase involved in cell wall biosynthesis